MTRLGIVALHRAFDETRFGPARTLDLRSSMPTADGAVRRAEPWLRERQMAKAGEVLVVTGRGRGSPDGVGVVREAIGRLLRLLKRKGVIATIAEHTAGSFVVTLAPIRALFEAAPRTGHRMRPEIAPDPSVLRGLSVASMEALRRLAVRSIETLGAPPTGRFVEDEMLRQFSVLSGAIAPDVKDREARLHALIRSALEAQDDVD